MPDGKPNILVIWGDDIGIANLSCYSHGLMGDRTPNIDRLGGLNAEEEPERPNYPPVDEFPQFHARFGRRGVLHCWASDDDDATEQPRWGRVGKQRIEDTGPLTKKRMETIATTHRHPSRRTEDHR